MTRQAIIDTGPLVAFLDKDEKHHQWARDQITQLTEPLLVCEPVLTETMFLLSRFPAAQAALLRLLENGALSVSFRLDENIPEVRTLLKKYADRPISLADACVVRMSELHDRHLIFTLDSDFGIYRKHGRQALRLIPFAKK